MENDEQQYQGAVIDDRTQEKKDLDYRFEELVAETNVVKWIEKKSSEWRKYPIFDQDGSGSCVAQTVAKMLGIMYQEKNGKYVHFSATHVYQRRSNKPQGGMAGTNALEIGKAGVTLEELVPSQNMSDSEMDAVVIPEYKHKVGEVFKAGNYITLPIQDIETIASVIQTTGKPVMVWYWFKHNEWTGTPEVKYPTLTTAAGSRHSVTAVDFCLINGKKCLIIDDSWGTKYGEKGQRIITEDFHSKRNFFAAYFQEFRFDTSEKKSDDLKPVHTFTQSMRYVPSAPVVYNNPEVMALQACLKYLGHYPSNANITGYFGSVTRTAVMGFQKSKGLTADGIVGPKTLAALNIIFS